MNEAHQRFHDWLTSGADGDPPRDVAVHASVCPGCSQSMDALDQLSLVNTGLAEMPAPPTGREHSRLVMAGRLVGATAILFSAAILGVGVSQLIGVSPSNGPVAQASPSPDQGVQAATATPLPTEIADTPVPTPSLAPETLTPLATPAPTHPKPAATPIPRQTPVPTPVVTPIPTVISTPTPLPTPAPVVPGAPQSVVAFASAASVEVTWQSPVSDGGAAITSYRIYRSTPSTAATLLAEVPVDAFFFEDVAVEPGTTYTYVVTALNAAGESPASAPSTVTTP